MNRIGLLIALALALSIGLTFAMRPDLDLTLAGLFFDPDRGGFWRSYDPFYLRARDASMWLVAALVMPAVIALVNGLAVRSRPWLMPGRAIVLMLATIALGPGVLTNLVLKEHWGRPRPIDVAEFGGEEHFRPWWDPRGDCQKNCSFVAGEPSGAFWTLAPAALVSPQWRTFSYAAALAFGCAVGLLRMATGAHFASDVAFAGIFMFLMIWLTYGCLYTWDLYKLRLPPRLKFRGRVDSSQN